MQGSSLRCKERDPYKVNASEARHPELKQQKSMKEDQVRSKSRVQLRVPPVVSFQERLSEIRNRGHFKKRLLK